MGRTQDARQELQNALRLDPDSADTHAAMGWTYLQRGNRAKASEHFREALRLDPNSEAARKGVLETLRSHNPIYRPLLKFFFWMQSLGGRAQWGVIIGAYVVYRILLTMANENPVWRPFLMPVVFGYIAFAAATWIGKPLMNLALRLHPFGRLALSREERIAANWIGCFLAAGLAALLGAQFYPGILKVLALTLLVMVIPLAAMFRIREPKPRKAAIAYTVLIGLCGGLFLVGCILGPDPPNGIDEPSLAAAMRVWGFLGLLLGAFVSPLVSNILVSINWKR